MGPVIEHDDDQCSEAGLSAVANMAPPIELFHQVPFYVEGCYVQLWRIIERCSSGKKPWAGLYDELAGFRPVGVRDARNARFEHVDHDNLASWGWSAGGPRLYPDLILRGGAIDRGLVPNVQEYVDDLDGRLAQLHTRLTGS